MDDTLTVGGSTTISADSGTAVTETADQSTATGSAAPET